MNNEKEGKANDALETNGQEYTRRIVMNMMFPTSEEREAQEKFKNRLNKLVERVYRLPRHWGVVVCKWKTCLERCGRSDRGDTLVYFEKFVDDIEEAIAADREMSKPQTSDG